MIFRTLSFVFCFLFISCSHNSSTIKSSRSPASLSFSNLPRFKISKWLNEISNTDVYRNREAGTSYSKAAAGKIVKAFKVMKMFPGVKNKYFFQNFKTKNTASQNIIAKSHNDNRKPQIIISAHYNRVSFCSPQTKSSKNCFVRSDNASGTIAALKLAHLIKQNSPDIPFVISLWGAEELKDAGSMYFSKNPSISLDKIKLHINFDLIGNNNFYISALNTQSSDYHKALESFKEKNFRFASSNHRSDYRNFFREGYEFPTLFISDHDGSNLSPASSLKRMEHRQSQNIELASQATYKIINESNSLTSSSGFIALSSVDSIIRL